MESGVVFCAVCSLVLPDYRHISLLPSCVCCCCRKNGRRRTRERTNKGRVEERIMGVTQDTDGLSLSLTIETHTYPSPNAARTLAHAATNLCPNPARPLLSPLPPSPSTPSSPIPPRANSPPSPVAPLSPLIPLTAHLILSAAALTDYPGRSTHEVRSSLPCCKTQPGRRCQVSSSAAP